MSEYAVIEVVEELYHTSMASLAAYALMQDTYYAAKPKRHFSVPDIAILVFHSIFLGRHLLCHVLPRKLLYLVDMLLHVCHLFSDVMLVVALVHCQREPLQLATGRMLWGGGCHLGSLTVAVVSFVYQVAALIAKSFKAFFVVLCSIYYNRGPDVAPLSEEFEVEHTLRTEEVCSASFELRYRPASAGFTGRCTAHASASATLREDNRDY
ncbi:hypothetical protein MTO96_005094 [Rhipicephalus appendiculatus]